MGHPSCPSHPSTLAQRTSNNEEKIFPCVFLHASSLLLTSPHSMLPFQAGRRCRKLKAPPAITGPAIASCSSGHHRRSTMTCACNRVVGVAPSQHWWSSSPTPTGVGFSTPCRRLQHRQVPVATRSVRWCTVSQHRRLPVATPRVILSNTDGCWLRHPVSSSPAPAGAGCNTQC